MLCASIFLLLSVSPLQAETPPPDGARLKAPSDVVSPADRSKAKQKGANKGGAPAGGNTTDAPANAADGDALLAVSLLPLSARDLETNDSHRLDAIMRKTLDEVAGFALQDESTTVALYESAQSLGLDCNARQVQCAAQLGQLAETERVVVGRATRFDQGIALALRLVDADNEKSLALVTQLLPLERAAQIPTIRDMITALLSPHPPQCDVNWSGSPDDLQLTFDGEHPTSERTLKLAPGVHVLTGIAKGYFSETRVLEIGTCRPTSVTLALRADPNFEVRTGPSLVELVLPWVFAAGGAVLAIGGAAAMGIGTTPAVLFFAYSNGYREDYSDDNGAADASATYQSAHGAAGAWNAWGRFVLAAGGVAAVIGIAVAAAGAGWGGYVLSIDPDEREE